jgi:hypothetical protein
LKNEFERNLKKKKKTNTLSPSLPILLAQPTKSQAGWPFPSSFPAQANRPSGPDLHPAGPAPHPFPFSFCFSRCQVGPGRQGRPQPLARSAAPHPARRQPFPAVTGQPPSPRAFKPRLYAAVKPPITSPPLIRPLSLFNPPS